MHSSHSDRHKSSPQIQELRHQIELRFGQTISSPSDFDQLGLTIWEQQREYISPTTLKRLWGYVEGADSARLSSLHILSHYVGATDWFSFCQSLLQHSPVESEVFAGDGVLSQDLQEGQLLEVQWAPNRRCILQYLGGNQYRVILSENSKLHAQDTFSAACFLIGHPLYMNNLIHDNGTPTQYVAGTKHGLANVRMLNGGSH